MASRSELREPMAETQSEDEDSGSIRDTVSLRWLLIGAIALGGPALLVNALVPVVGGPVGVFIGAFVVGILGIRRGYVLAGVFGVLLGVTAAVVDPRLLSLAESTRVLQLAAVGGGGGLLVSLLGVYFGRDLRSGLTRDIE